jgi:hypothetical protein
MPSILPAQGSRQALDGDDMTRTTRACGSVLTMLGIAIVSGCASQPEAPAAATEAATPQPAHPDLAYQAYALRQNALIQQQAIALRGRVAYFDDRPVPPEPAPAGPTPGPPEGRDLIYWTDEVAFE